MSRKVQLDLHALGYTSADLCACLASLTIDDYRGSKDYGDGWQYDVYTPRFAASSGSVDELYVKVAQRDTPVAQVFVRSFHLQRL